MKPRDYAVALFVSLAMVTVVAYPSYDRMQGYSIDILFWLRNLFAPPRIDPAQYPSVVVAIDEKTYQTAPFEGKPRAMWTPQLAKDDISALFDTSSAARLRSSPWTSPDRILSDLFLNAHHHRF